MNKYLEKIAENNGATTWDATKLQLKATGRSALEGVGGALAGGALGIGAGALALKTRTGARAIGKLRMAADKKTMGVINHFADKKTQRSLMAKGIGAATLGTAGLGTGLIHGGLKSTRNSLDSHTEKKAAFDVLIQNGIDFDSAVELVKQAELEVYGK